MLTLGAGVLYYLGFGSLAVILIIVLIVLRKKQQQ
jgi:hypothetical protein